MRAPRDDMREAPRDADRETIVAVASPPGRGVRAIVRASGPAVPAMVEAVLDGAPAARGVSMARIRLAGGCGARNEADAVAWNGARDEVREDAHDYANQAVQRSGGRDAVGRAASLPVVASRALAGASFTGEDALEIACVASPAAVDAVVAALVGAARARGYGARLAQPGEFAFRAHRAGRLDLDEAEAIAARIAATGDAELAAAGELARGRYAQRAAALADEVASLLARVEAGIDFADEEDVIAVPARAVAEACARLATAAGALRGSEAAARSAPRPRVVLAGAPNAGKSSLFNALVGRARVVASPERGTTRDAVVAGLALGGGLEVDLVDLAGLEMADGRAAGDGAFEVRSESASGDPRECAREAPCAALSCTASSGLASEPTRAIADRMQETARHAIRAADLVVRCTPVGDAPFPIATEAPIVEVSTMEDLRDRADPADPAPRARDASTVATSTRTGEGIAALRAELARRLRTDRALRQASLAAILPRHDAAFAAAADQLAQAAALAHGARGEALPDPELVASLLRTALDRLGEVSGAIHPDDVLGLVFSRFCIGK